MFLTLEIARGNAAWHLLTMSTSQNPSDIDWTFHNAWLTAPFLAGMTTWEWLQANFETIVIPWALVARQHILVTTRQGLGHRLRAELAPFGALITPPIALVATWELLLT